MSDEELDPKKQLEEFDESYIVERYDKSIKYYDTSGSNNKKTYKRSRILTIVLGALVTLISSLSAASFIQDHETISIIFAILTPVIAATLTIVGGFTQSFHWGATWRDMSVSAALLRKEKDRFLATDPDKRDLVKELDSLNSLIIDETRNFFQRVLDSEVKPADNGDDNTTPEEQPPTNNEIDPQEQNP